MESHFVYKLRKASLLVLFLYSFKNMPYCWAVIPRDGILLLLSQVDRKLLVSCTSC
jgi:hypothetical protein